MPRYLFFGKQVAPGKRPLKVNVFENMLAHQGMLEQVPLFPYFGPGDIVPTAALSLMVTVSASANPRRLSTSSICPLACRFCPGMPIVASSVVMRSALREPSNCAWPW